MILTFAITPPLSLDISRGLPGSQVRTERVGGAVTHIVYGDLACAECAISHNIHPISS